MTADKSSWLRPSMLPKLAQCGHYRPEPKAGEAAARGSMIDELFRKAIAGENVSVEHLSSEDREALRWAVDTARALAGGYALESREEYLRTTALGLTGTADLLCMGACWSADLKTGQKRGYIEQQALYALGFMEDTFADEWTTYLLYADLQEVETLRFMRGDARRIVREVLAKAAEPGAPEPNSYCSWCAKRFECPARKESLGIVPFDGPNAIDLANASSPQLREFVLRAAVVEDFAKEARELLKARCLAGEKIPGVSLTSKRGPRKLAVVDLMPAVQQFGAESVLAVLGMVSEEKARDLWDKVEAPFPANKVQEMPGSSYIRVGRPKA